ncbi:MAG: hypothetical protein ACJA0C_001322 [Candidatus Endobugula sp.]
MYMYKLPLSVRFCPRLEAPTFGARKQNHLPCKGLNIYTVVKTLYVISEML